MSASAKQAAEINKRIRDLLRKEVQELDQGQTQLIRAIIEASKLQEKQKGLQEQYAYPTLRRKEREKEEQKMERLEYEMERWDPELLKQIEEISKTRKLTIPEIRQLKRNYDIKEEERKIRKQIELTRIDDIKEFKRLKKLNKKNYEANKKLIDVEFKNYKKNIIDNARKKLTTALSNASKKRKGARRGPTQGTIRNRQEKAKRIFEEEKKKANRLKISDVKNLQDQLEKLTNEYKISEQAISEDIKRAEKKRYGPKTKKTRRRKQPPPEPEEEGEVVLPPVVEPPIIVEGPKPKSEEELLLEQRELEKLARQAERRRKRLTEAFEARHPRERITKRAMSPTEKTKLLVEKPVRKAKESGFGNFSDTIKKLKKIFPNISNKNIMNSDYVSGVKTPKGYGKHKIYKRKRKVGRPKKPKSKTRSIASKKAVEKNSWLQYVKKTWIQLKKKYPDATYKEAMKVASYNRKNEGGFFNC